jgi:hypothetical protein
MHQPELPKMLHPGEQAMYIVPIPNFLSETERLQESFYRRGWLGQLRPRRLYGIVWTADSYTFHALAAKSVRALLQHRDPDRLTGAILNSRREAA